MGRVLKGCGEFFGGSGGCLGAFWALSGKAQGHLRILEGFEKILGGLAEKFGRSGVIWGYLRELSGGCGNIFLSLCCCGGLGKVWEDLLEVLDRFFC